MKNKLYPLLFLSMFICFIGLAQDSKPPKVEPSKMEWFKQAKLGIFIHWGIYSVAGISESWSFYNEYLTHEDYLRQLDGFNAAEYRPMEWAQLIEDSGAKYAVITSKHHDGVALWNSQYGQLNTQEHTAAQSDLLSPLVKALRKKKLRLGLYFSLPDWSSEEYPIKTKNQNRYVIEDDPMRWSRYLNYMNGQLGELKERYSPDLWWFDGDWEQSAQRWESAQIRARLLEKQPQTIINSRLQGYGDYETPEIGVPVYRPEADYWELCLTMNDSWGYQATDHNYKTTQQLIDLFVDTISKGGNLLLNISPKADGSIPEPQKERLLELGAWIKKHQTAIYPTQRGIAYEHFYGPTTLSKDRETLFLFVRDIPKDGNIVVKGISNRINRAYVVGQGSILEQQKISKLYWNSYPGVSYIKLPKETLDPNYTVVALVLDGPLELYKETNSAVTQN